MDESWEPRSGSLVTERNLVHEPLSKYLYQEYKHVTERFKKKGYLGRCSQSGRGVIVVSVSQRSWDRNKRVARCRGTRIPVVNLDHMGKKRTQLDVQAGAHGSWIQGMLYV